MATPPEITMNELSSIKEERIKKEIEKTEKEKEKWLGHLELAEKVLSETTNNEKETKRWVDTADKCIQLFFQHKKSKYEESISDQPEPVSTTDDSELTTGSSLDVTSEDVSPHNPGLPVAFEKPKYTEKEEGEIACSIDIESGKEHPDLKEEFNVFVEREVEIIIHVVKDCEYYAALTHMTPHKFKGGDKLDNKFVCYPRPNSILGMFGKYKVALVQTEMGGNAEVEIEMAVIKDFLEAKYVIALGMAYGRSKDKCNLGDVLVSKQIHDLSKNVKFLAGSIIDRGHSQDVQLDLVQVFTRQIGLWTIKEPFICTKSPISAKSKAIVGTILSPPWNMQDEEIKEKVFRNKFDAVGGEMEGNVLVRLRDYMQRNHTDRSLGVIIIKGVADHGDKNKDDNWQFTASMAAAAFTKFKLSKRML